MAAVPLQHLAPLESILDSGQSCHGRAHVTFRDLQRLLRPSQLLLHLVKLHVLLLNPRLQGLLLDNRLLQQLGHPSQVLLHVAKRLLVLLTLRLHFLLLLLHAD
ncbi:MAG: hypothetical protein GY772_30695 [bacterium]|nr:hypothetical protein [bacterium]